MSFLQEFIERGYLAQCTDLDALKQKFNQEKIYCYIGFDCTANTLHAGSLIQIMILRLLQKHGHYPIVLLGGGTTKIGDPSGKDEARKILDNQQISENLSGIKRVLEKFIDFSNNKALIINNVDWLENLNYIDFLRDVGKHFSINRMLTFDSVKTRLDREQPLSFLEFNYMILQAFDFYYLHKNYNCTLQIGGSDQWGNIVNGVELIRKLNFEEKQNRPEAFGLTTPLLTTADGKKMGKTANGAVWLSENDLPAFEYFQFFRNTHDDDVIKFLKLFTDLNLAQIAKYSHLSGQELNQVKEILAFEATKICHGEDTANNCLKKARQIFLQKNSEAFEEIYLDLPEIGIKLTDIITAIKATESKAEAKRLIEGKAVKINNNLVNDINLIIQEKTGFELAVGKKKFFKI
ncbi:MAG: tyrosine--tRNA ligase, partial [Alphaproteobacteria bacterium]